MFKIYKVLYISNFKIQFIELWKTFYELIGIRDDNQLYHALVVAGTLLLQLGETQKVFQHGVEKQIDEAMKTTLCENEREAGTPTPELEEPSISKSTSKMGDLKSWLASNRLILVLFFKLSL